MKTCPFCREEIRDEAIKCRYCSSSLLPLQPAVDQLASTAASTSDDRVTYILDKDLIRFAKFAIAVLAIFVAIGAYFYGFKVEQEADKVRDSADKVTAIQRDALKTNDEIQKAKDQVASNRAEAESLLKNARKSLDSARNQLASIKATQDNAARMAHQVELASQGVAANRSEAENLVARARQSFDTADQQIKSAQREINSAQENAVRIAKQAEVASATAQSAAEKAGELLAQSEEAVQAIAQQRATATTVVAELIEVRAASATQTRNTKAGSFQPAHLYTEAETLALVKADADKAFEYFSRHGFDKRFPVKISEAGDLMNAFWDGSNLQFGMGMVNSELFGPYEPGVVYYIAAHSLLRLPYEGASGAIFLSISDVLAVVIRGDGWTIGTVRQPDGRGVLRSLENPGHAYDNTALGKDTQPDHMSGYVRATTDNGGIHTNSGILNKAAYLISEGGTHHGITVAHGLGRAKLGDLYMEVVKQLAAKPIAFTQFRDLLSTTAQRMYGADASATVREAFKAVGL